MKPPANKRGRRRLALAACALLAACAPPDPLSIEGRPGGPYSMTLSAPTAVIAPATQTMLTTRLRHRSSGQPLQDLQVLHERVVHNFIVNRDFSSFAHIHHEDFAALDDATLENASFRFPYTFPAAGHYRLVSQFTHADRTWTKHFDLAVGAATPQPPVIDLARTRTVGAYTASLHSEPAAPVAGFETAFELELMRGSEPVTDLELILGSEVHVAVWRTDGSLFGHTHSYTPHMAAMLGAMHDRNINAGERAAAMQAMMVRMMAMPAELVFPGPRVPVHYVFPEAGTYVMFFHCAPGGRAEVFRFMVAVAPAPLAP